MSFGKLMFLLAVYLILVGLGVVIGYFITRILSDIVARQRVRKIQNQVAKQFEKLKK